MWIGPSLSSLERLSLQSFLAQGYIVRLFTYGPVDNIPSGVEIRHGSEVLPSSEIFVYSQGFGKGSPSAFSNMFRYRLLLDYGGWWTDLDVVCLKPLPTHLEYVFGYQRTRRGRLHVATGVMRMPPNSRIAHDCWEACRRVDKETVRWGEIGPRLMHTAIANHQLTQFVLPPKAFYPVHCFRVTELVKPDGILPSESYCVHFWHAMWSELGLDPDAKYPVTSIYEVLKRRFL